MVAEQAVENGGERIDLLRGTRQRASVTGAVVRILLRALHERTFLGPIGLRELLRFPMAAVRVCVVWFAEGCGCGCCQTLAEERVEGMRWPSFWFVVARLFVGACVTFCAPRIALLMEENQVLGFGVGKSRLSAAASALNPPPPGPLR